MVPMTVYQGTCSDGKADVTANGKPLAARSLPTDPRQNVPYSWGKNFNGADRLALSLLEDCVDKEAAILLLGDFVKQVISRLGNEWEMTSDDIKEFCDYKQRIGTAVQKAKWSTVETSAVRKTELPAVLPPKIIADPN